MIDVSIVIVSFNTKQILKECIESIIHTCSEVSYEIVVIDNASTDGSVEEVQSSKFEVRSSQLKIIKNKENLGFSKANNQGVDEAKGKYILFLNSDTVMREKTLETMVEFMDKNPDAGAATCKVELLNGSLDDAAHRGFPTPWNSFSYFSGLTKVFPKSKLFSGYWMGWLDTSKTHEIDALAGAFMMVRKSAGEEVGWWDEDFFFYGEDLDFCYRLKEKGWKIYFVPTVSVLHYKGISGGIKKHSEHVSTATEETRKRAKKARFEAMRLFYKKHYLKKYPKFATWFILKGIDIKEKISS